MVLRQSLSGLSVPHVGCHLWVYGGCRLWVDVADARWR